MSSLELKIPPPLVALLIGLGMWGLSYFPPLWDIDPLVRYIVSAFVAAIGVVFAVSGFIAFGLAKTTVNPLQPGKATTLVTTGVYRVTRNPMYVGLLLILLALAFLLRSPWSFLGPVSFFAWINYLQIIPEERILATLFGEEYKNYQSRVRRWL